MKHRRYYKRENRDRFYKEAKDKQDGACAICGKRTRLVIDHDRTTGLMRGLLCYKHNSGLGAFDDNPEMLKAALVYLEQAIPFVELPPDKKPTEIRVFLEVKKYAKDLVLALLQDNTFTSDRARARVLAEKVGIPETTAQTRIHRARRKLDDEAMYLQKQTVTAPTLASQ
jgi:hypothetical protein